MAHLYFFFISNLAVTAEVAQTVAWTRLDVEAMGEAGGAPRVVEVEEAVQVDRV